MMRSVVLPELPSMGAAFWRGVMPKPPRPPAVAGHQLVVPGHSPEVDRLARYARVCGFTLRDALPPTWLHVLTFPLHVHLLADPATTLPLAGLVHVGNRMTVHRPVLLTEQLEISCGIGNLRPHRRGALVDLTGQVHVGDELIWEGVSSYLARGVSVGSPPPATEDGPRGPTAAPPTPREKTAGTVPGGPEPGGAVAVWRLPADLGRRYRDVAGDPNPIHTSRLAAKAFGFARPIVHGMWTHARALAALENRLPPAYEVAVEFTKPILLPSTVGFVAGSDHTGWDAAVTTRHGSKPHLLARIDFR
ncbi:MAG: hypothetical protein KIT69_19165 [Propionibacteriaceae bacterium]|nr:hypothetical protein [Propionibacteriaceae bacterium]